MKKKVALITGGNSNLGTEITKRLSSAGFVVYSPSLSELDITDDNDCREYIRKIVKDQGKIDVLVNCAGVTPIGPLLEISADDYLKTLNINTVGAFRLIRESVPYMGKKNMGKIININSLNGLVSLPNYGIYSASKHALEALSFALRQELKDKNIYVTSVLPGAILNEKKVNSPQTNEAPQPNGRGIFSLASSGAESLRSETASLNHGLTPGVFAKGDKPAREKFFILKVLMPFVTAEKVASSVLKVAMNKKPRARVILGNDAKIMTFLMKILPFNLWDRLVFYVWNHK